MFLFCSIVFCFCIDVVSGVCLLILSFSMVVVFSFCIQFTHYSLFLFVFFYKLPLTPSSSLSTCLYLSFFASLLLVPLLSSVFPLSRACCYPCFFLLLSLIHFFFFNSTATPHIYTLSPHDALPFLLLFFVLLGFLVRRLLLRCLP